MAFRVGQKVASLGSSRSWRDWFDSILHPYDFPPKGTVCTVVSAMIDEEGSWIKISEHYAYDENYWSDWFAAGRFVPIVERKTDISALKALLVPGAKIRENA